MRVMIIRRQQIVTLPGRYMFHMHCFFDEKIAWETINFINIQCQ